MSALPPPQLRDENCVRERPCKYHGGERLRERWVEAPRGACELQQQPSSHFPRPSTPPDQHNNSNHNTRQSTSVTARPQARVPTSLPHQTKPASPLPLSTQTHSQRGRPPADLPGCRHLRDQPCTTPHALNHLFSLFLLPLAAFKSQDPEASDAARTARRG